MRGQFRFLLILAALMVFGVVAAFLTKGRPTGDERSPDSPPSTATREEVDRCSNEGVRDLLARFAKAVTEGDEEAILLFFDDSFQWYSAPGIQNANPTVVTVYRLQELPAYFAERFHQHERLTIEKVQVNSRIIPGTTRRVDFGLEIYRQADDLTSQLGVNGTVVLGKGTVDCDQQKIWVLSLGDPVKTDKGQ